MNTKTRSVGRPAAKLIYPEGTFTIHQLFALNKKKVKWELSIRQHLDRAIAKRWVSKERATLQTGNVGKPAHLFHVTKRGQIKLSVKTSGGTPAETTVVAEISTPTVAVEVPVNEIVSAPAPITEPVPAPTTIVDSTLAALTPAS